jgi:hypothetical protein
VLQQNLCKGLPTTTTVYTSVTRLDTNVVNTANQILGAEYRAYTRGRRIARVFFMPGKWMFDQRRLFLVEHSNYSSISGPFCFKQHRRVCIDALGAISFLTRGTAAKAATGLTMASAKGFDFICFCPPNSTTVSWRIVEISAEKHQV